MTARLYQAIVDSGRAHAQFVEMDWNGTREYLWSGYGDFDWQRPGDDTVRTWTGTGSLGRITLPEQTGEMQVSEIVLELSGVDGNLYDDINAPIRGGELLVWVCHLGDDYTVFIEEQIATGVLDRVTWVDDGNTGTIQVYARGDFPFLENQQISRWTPEVQRAYLTSLGEDPDTDTGFDLIHTMQDKNLAWLPS